MSLGPNVSLCIVFAVKVNDLDIYGLNIFQVLIDFLSLHLYRRSQQHYLFEEFIINLYNDCPNPARPIFLAF
jgi:hypothetical protein